MQKISPTDALVAALETERADRDIYGPASEPVAFEIARAADSLLMGDLLGFAPKGKLDRTELSSMSLASFHKTLSVASVSP